MLMLYYFIEIEMGKFLLWIFYLWLVQYFFYFFIQLAPNLVVRYNLILSTKPWYIICKYQVIWFSMMARSPLETRWFKSTINGQFWVTCNYPIQNIKALHFIPRSKLIYPLGLATSSCNTNCRQRDHGSWPIVSTNLYQSLTVYENAAAPWKGVTT